MDTIRDGLQAKADALGISQAALELYLDAEVVDLHNDMYVPARLFGYDVHRAHWPSAGGPAPSGAERTPPAQKLRGRVIQPIFTRLLGARYFGHTDLPRLRKAGVTGVVLDVATNPARRGSRRAPVALDNLAQVRADVARHASDLRLVSSYREYQAARAAGLTACMLGIQGGQAFQHDRAALEAIPADVHRVTLVHLTNSRIGSTSSPLGLRHGGLTDRGRELVERLDAQRILVDLAHIDRAGFFDAVGVHDASLPLIVSHTGVAGVRPHWRNIDDEQIEAVAATGGTIGIVFAAAFLAPVSVFRRCPAERVIDHMQHIIKVVGDDHISIGSDYDGLVVPPSGLETVMGLPRLVELMLARGWGEPRIRKALGLNALRVFEAIRP